MHKDQIYTPEDILHNGGLENLDDYTIFRRRIPERRSRRAESFIFDRVLINMELIPLKKWYLKILYKENNDVKTIKSSSDNNSNYGLVFLGELDNGTFIRSSYITERISERVVKTENTTYELIGEMDMKKKMWKHASNDLNYIFVDGFPDNWKDVIEGEIKKIMGKEKNKICENDKKNINNEKTSEVSVVENNKEDDLFFKQNINEVFKQNEIFETSKILDDKNCENDKEKLNKEKASETSVVENNKEDDLFFKQNINEVFKQNEIFETSKILDDESVGSFNKIKKIYEKEKQKKIELSESLTEINKNIITNDLNIEDEKDIITNNQNATNEKEIITNDQNATGKKEIVTSDQNVEDNKEIEKILDKEEEKNTSKLTAEMSHLYKEDSIEIINEESINIFEDIGDKNKDSTKISEKDKKSVQEDLKSILIELNKKTMEEKELNAEVNEQKKMKLRNMMNKNVNDKTEIEVNSIEEDKEKMDNKNVKGKNNTTTKKDLKNKKIIKKEKNVKKNRTEKTNDSKVENKKSKEENEIEIKETLKKEVIKKQLSSTEPKKENPKRKEEEVNKLKKKPKKRKVRLNFRG